METNNVHSVWPKVSGAAPWTIVDTTITANQKINAMKATCLCQPDFNVFKNSVTCFAGDIPAPSDGLIG